MKFQKIVEQYFSELKKEIKVGSTSGQATMELSYRTSLDNFFKNIASNFDSNIATILEPRNQSKLGRPDWRFHNIESMGVYGYVEAKGLDQTIEINISNYKKQIERYLTLGNPVILTDGIDFVIFTTDKSIKKFSICSKPINWENPEFDFDIEILFKVFFKNVGYREISENQLVNEVAKRAKLLSIELMDLELDEDEAESESESKTLSLLKELKVKAQHSHDKTLSNNITFAGFISQILTFGLLYAHRVIDKSLSNPKEKYQKIHDFWFSYLEEDYTNKLIPFKTLVTELKSELNSDLSRLGIWYDDLRRLLAHIQLSTDQISVPDFHELYETFLAVYDPKTRFDYGAFYTPRSLAFYTTKLVKVIIENQMPQIDLKSTAHKIIDPCCGTGTFIEATLDSFNLNSSSSIIGFEILPAPYALAHYRIAMLEEKYPENIKIILTNTLSDSLFEETKIAINDSNLSLLLLQEQQSAYHLSSAPLTIIIGNPPSSDSKFELANEGLIIKKMLEDFRPSAVGRTGRQNVQKQLSNEFVKFLRWSVDKAIKSTPSVFALILPSSFAKHPSYKYVRKFIAEKFSNLWILEFDSDKRTGADDVNLFNTLQGRLLLIGIVTDAQVIEKSINYKNICNLSKSQKISFFNEEVDLENWTKLSLDDNFAFKPSDKYNLELYSSFWPITSDKESGIFLRHCSSLKLAPTHLLVHASKGQLKRRSKFISKQENDYTAIKDKWYSGQMKPPPSAKINDSIKIRLDKGIAEDNIYDYSYRPFLEASVLLDEKLLDELSNLGGGGTRDRPEIRSAYRSSSVFGFAVAPAPEDIGSTLHKFSSFCWNIPDNDLSARGNAHIFCNYFPDYKKSKNWNSLLKSNINEELVENLKNILGLESSEMYDELTFYTYAILSSNFYLKMFKGILFNVAGAWPRIPITTSKLLFQKIGNLGRTIAHIESRDYKIESLSTQMAELEYYKTKIGIDSIQFIGKANDVIITLKDLKESVLSFEVSGYNVIKEWLKMHSYPYYRKKMESTEINELYTLIAKIEIYQSKIMEIDIVVEEILKNKLLEPF